jgi:hypothetical protein
MKNRHKTTASIFWSSRTTMLGQYTKADLQALDYMSRALARQSRCNVNSKNTSIEKDYYENDIDESFLKTSDMCRTCRNWLLDMCYVTNEIGKHGVKGLNKKAQFLAEEIIKKTERELNTK